MIYRYFKNYRDSTIASINVKFYIKCSEKFILWEEFGGNYIFFSVMVYEDVSIKISKFPMHYIYNIGSKFIRKTNGNNLQTHTFYVSLSLYIYIFIYVYMYYICIYTSINERRYKNISFKKILSSI